MNPNKLGLNDPCPCGSGRKFKRCCQGNPNHDIPAPERSTAPTSGKFRFEPGSYGGTGMYAASISCLKQVRPDEWVYHFVLANSGFAFENEQEAVEAAQRHLNEAGAEKARTGSDAVFATYLANLGYLRVEGFKVIDAPAANQG